MKKILGKIILLTVCMAFMLSGCSSKPDEKKVTEDLKSFENENLKSGGEKIDSVKIDNSESNDDSYTLYCTVKTEKNDISYEKQVNAIYKKSKEWELANVQVNINSEWKITPLKGVSKKVIESDSLKAVSFSGFMPKIYISQEGLEKTELLEGGLYVIQIKMVN